MKNTRNDVNDAKAAKRRHAETASLIRQNITFALLNVGWEELKNYSVILNVMIMESEIKKVYEKCEKIENCEVF